MRAMYVSTAVERTRSELIALVIALSLLLSALPASAGPYAARGLDAGWDFLDPSGITWEKTPKNITWEQLAPKDLRLERLLRSITWE